MCYNCKNKCKMAKKVMSIECKKVYYINDEELVEEIDKLIKKFEKENDGGLIQTLDGEDGEDRPKQKPPNE